MVKFHYHTAASAIPRLGLEPGDRLVHAYSDASLAELEAWGKERGLRAEWIDRRNSMPHFDLFGGRLALAGPGVTRAELVADLRAWRAWSGRRRGTRGKRDRPDPPVDRFRRAG